MLNQNEINLNEQVADIISSGIEDKNIIERITNEDIRDSKKLLNIETITTLGEDGSPKDEIIRTIPNYSCGHASKGRENYGGVDYRGNITCVRCFCKCYVCFKPLTKGKTAVKIRDRIYCRHHSNIEKIKIVMRWIFG